MPPYKLSKVGMDTGSLTDEDLRYLDRRVIETVRYELIGRLVYPRFALPNAGQKTWRRYSQTDMSQATISMEGITQVDDRIELVERDTVVPVISKDFILFWRDILASRGGGLPIDVLSAQNAARQVAEEEDKLLLSGEYTGWPALGIEGLATATGRNTEASAGAWPANCLTDISDAIAELETDGHYGPYALIVVPDNFADLRTLIANTAEPYLTVVQDGNKYNVKVFKTPNLFASDGGQDSAIVCEPKPQNFEVGIARDITTYTWQDKNMNTYGKVYEVITPKIHRPTSICEITGIT